MSKNSYGRELMRLAFVVIVIIAAFSMSFEPKTEPEVIIEPSRSEVKLVDYFRRNGSPHPERMATAVLQTNKPRLLSAIAVVESNATESAINKRSKAKGAFQVKEKHWGKVPHDVVEQALQADRILDELYTDNKGNLRATLNNYGGDKTQRKYASVILKELQEVPR